MANPEKEEIKKARSNNTSILTVFGALLILAGAGILVVAYAPLFKAEIAYRLSPQGKGVIVAGINENADQPPTDSDSSAIIRPVDEDFGLVIPKISANSKVIADVDPDNSVVYQRALTQGVAHARGTAYPGNDGNIFIFAHSGIDFYEALHYNAVFYLLDKLEKNDKVYIFYKGREISYKVSDKKVVLATDIKYFEGDGDTKTLTLMTCWPPGTTWKRLVVIAVQADEK